MADEDDSQKTEDPSSRKLAKGREKGQVAVSQEIKNAVVLLAGTLFLAALAPKLMRDVRDIGFTFIEQPNAIPVDFDHMRLVFTRVTLEMGLAMMPVMGLLMFAAIVSSVAQVGFLWSPSKLELDPGKISPMKGLKRMFSTRAVVEFLKGILKLAVVAAVSFGIAVPPLKDVSLFPLYPTGAFLDRLQDEAVLLGVGALSVMIVISALDFAYQKFAFIKQMRMTKQEVKDEHKQSEGDPMIKRRIATLRMERARQRMMAAVPKADVVVTNPTHFAVALMYRMDEMSAPILVAKGVDHLAMRIRTLAEEHDIPIVENPPLARALYATVELDQEVPPEHYKAVAEVIGYVMRLRGDLPQAAPAAQHFVPPR